jgi:hypothetical protein
LYKYTNFRKLFSVHPQQGGVWTKP